VAVTGSGVTATGLGGFVGFGDGEGLEAGAGETPGEAAGDAAGAEVGAAVAVGRGGRVGAGA